MKWAVIEEGDRLHVVPTLDGGGRMFHTLAVDCPCEPTVERHARTLVTHASMVERRRHLLRVWNLRRELRGKRGGLR